MNLKQASLSAGRWTAVSAAFRIAFQVLQMAILARLLDASDFGLMAVSGALISTLAIFSDLGLGRSVIHHRSPPRKVLSTLFWLNLAAAASLSLLTVGGAKALGIAYGKPELALVLLASSPVFIIVGAGQQLLALAEKELNFATVAINEVVSSAAGVIVSVASALLGFGVFSLVAGLLTTATTSSALIIAMVPRDQLPRLEFSIGEAKPYVELGGFFLFENLLGSIVRQMDILIGGLIARSSAMGQFAVPRDLALKVGMTVNPILTRVSFPVMARVKDEPERLRSIYLRAMRLTTAVNFPIYAALGLFSAEIVETLYGPRWSESADYLRILAAWGLVRSTGSSSGSLVYAMGLGKLAVQWNLAQLLSLGILLLPTAILAGLKGVSLALLVYQLLIFVPMWRFLVYRACGVSFRGYIQASLSAFGPTIIAVLAAYACSSTIENPTARLVAGLMVGAAAYTVSTMKLNPLVYETFVDVLSLRPRSKIDIP